MLFSSASCYSALVTRADVRVVCRPLDVQCKCGQTYCFACKEPEAHRPVACDTVQAWNIKNSAESENLTWIIANTKPCPECQRPIQKNQGCMHMTCSQCRHEFCWLCQGDWKKHGEGTGGYYACNKCALLCSCVLSHVFCLRSASSHSMPGARTRITGMPAVQAYCAGARH